MDPAPWGKLLIYTLEFEKEYQITQPGPNLKVMETCYEDLEENDEYSTEEVQTTISDAK